jgi:hypothetical protein
MRIVPWLVLSCIGAAHAVEPYSCRNGLFPRAAGTVSAAVVSAADKVPFRDDAEGCPQADSCVRKAYLVKGDAVLVSSAESGLSCAWYFGRTREFVGWLPSEALTALPAAAPSPSDWIGTWVPIAGGQSIRIAGGGAAFELSGEAQWRGGRDEAGEPVVHVGSFRGRAAPAGDRLTLDADGGESGCVVRMQLVSRSLVVSDNALCGGVNVRFDNVYRRRP